MRLEYSLNSDRLELGTPTIHPTADGYDGLSPDSLVGHCRSLSSFDHPHSAAEQGGVKLITTLAQFKGVASHQPELSVLRGQGVNLSVPRYC